MESCTAFKSYASWSMGDYYEMIEEYLKVNEGKNQKIRKGEKNSDYKCRVF